MSIGRWWLLDLIISGRDGEGENSTGTGDAGQPPAGSTGQQDPPKGETKGADGDDDDEFKSEESKARVLSDLAKERKDRRTLAARVKELEAAQTATADKEKSDLERTTGERDKAVGRVERLATGYRDMVVKEHVVNIATKLGYADPLDAYTLLKANGFDGVDIEQDDDDLSKVEVDDDQLTAKLKRELKARPHWAKQETNSGAPTGSPFNSGTGPRGAKQTDDEALMQAYPALRVRGGARF